MQRHLLCLALIAALGAAVICLLPGAVAADWTYPRPVNRAEIVRTQRWLGWLIQPPNTVAQALGMQHLEYEHLLDAGIGGSSSRAHDIQGCACTPREMRGAFFAVAWPFWFIVLFAATWIMLAAATAKRRRSG